MCRSECANVCSSRLEESRVGFMNRNLVSEREIPEQYDTLSIDRGVLLCVVKARTDVKSHFHSTTSLHSILSPWPCCVQVPLQFVVASVTDGKS
jgi:hypothetical protein